MLSDEFRLQEIFFEPSTDHNAKGMCSGCDIDIVADKLKYSSCKKEGNWRYFRYFFAYIFPLCKLPLWRFTQRGNHFTII